MLDSRGPDRFPPRGKGRRQAFLEGAVYEFSNVAEFPQRNIVGGKVWLFRRFPADRT